MGYLLSKAPLSLYIVQRVFIKKILTIDPERVLQAKYEKSIQHDLYLQQDGSTNFR